MTSEQPMELSGEEFLAGLSQEIPCMYDTATGSLRIQGRIERQLKEYSSYYAVELSPIRSKQSSLWRLSMPLLVKICMILKKMSGKTKNLF